MIQHLPLFSHFLPIQETEAHNSYGRPLLHARLFPDLNTIPNNCVWENSLQLSGYSIGFLSGSAWLESRQDLIFLPCINSFVSLLQT